MLSGPVVVCRVGTGLEIPAVNAGMDMRPQVEGQTESYKKEQGASQG